VTALIQRSFAGGEIAPSLYARVDQSKYATGLRTLRNFFVMRHGGAANRPGTQFVGEVKDSSKSVRLIPFIFNEEQTYVLEFGNSYMRVIQDGSHLTDVQRVITGATQANPCVVTSTAHGFSNGDEVYISGVAGMTELNNRNFKVNNVAANTFELQYMDSTDVDSSAFGAYSADGTASRIYTLETPYAEADLMTLQYVQSADVVTIVHRNYKPMELSRLDHTSWTLTEISFAPTIEPPTNVAADGTTGTVEEYVVTSVAAETFEESLQSSADGRNAAATSGSPTTITWTVASGAASYNVYKTKNGVYGFIGSAVGTTFVDNGITADTEDTPPTLSGIIADLVFGLSKLDDPADLPGSDSRGLALSPDATILAVAHDNSPRVTLYEIAGETFTKLANPADLPTGGGRGCAFNDTGDFFAVAHNTTPFVTIYERSGTTFTKVANPANLPAGNATGCAWQDDDFLAVSHATSPFVTIYQRSGTTFTKLSNPGTLPTGQGNGVSWFKNRVGIVTVLYLAVAHDTSPYITVYWYSGSFTKYTNPTTLPTGSAKGCAWSNSGDYLAVAHATSPYISIYQRSGTTSLTKLSDPADLPPGMGLSCAWSDDDQYLSVTHQGSPYVTIYQRSGTTFTKMPDPGTLPPDDTNASVWFPDAEYFAVAHDTTPYVTIYEEASSNPSVVSYLQQRLMLANTPVNPEKVWGSKTGVFKNFTLSRPLQDDDALSFRLAGRQVNAVKHILELGKPVMLTTSGEWVIGGDSSGIIRPGEINPRQEGYNGASDLSPIVIGGNALYVQARGSIVRDLAFSFEADGYRGNDLTIFSAHLVDGHNLVDWAYQKIPNSIVWMVRDDGVLLGLTYVPEHQMLAWHRHDFDGSVENVCSIPEGNEDSLYVVVQRTIDGSSKRYIERFAPRFNQDVEDMVFMDCALTYDGRNTGATTMTLSGGTDWDHDEQLTLTSSVSFFTANDVGNAIHLFDDDGTVVRCTIEAYTDVDEVTIRPHTTVPASMQSVAISTWSRAVDEITGLWHLEGQDVAIYADGFVVASPNNEAYVVRTVTDGTVTLDRPYAVIHIGLPFISDLQTLDIDTPDGETVADKKKLITKVSAHVESSRGIFAGSHPPTDDDDDPLEGLMEFKLRNDESYDDPVALKTDVVDVPIQSDWNSNGRVFIRQIDPLPLTILSVIPTGLVPLRG